MSLATEFLQDLKEGFANKDSSSVGGFVTDDFELISPVTRHWSVYELIVPAVQWANYDKVGTPAGQGC